MSEEILSTDSSSESTFVNTGLMENPHQFPLLNDEDDESESSSSDDDEEEDCDNKLRGSIKFKTNLPEKRHKNWPKNRSWDSSKNFAVFHKNVAFFVPFQVDLEMNKWNKDKQNYDGFKLKLSSINWPKVFKVNECKINALFKVKVKNEDGVKNHFKTSIEIDEINKKSRRFERFYCSFG